MLSEPMTMLTDYALTVLGGLLGARLVRTARREGQISIGLWGAALLATAFGAFLGGTSHGFAAYLSPAAAKTMWLATYGAIGLANALLLAGAFVAETTGRVRPWLVGATAVQLAAYAAWVSTHREFRYVLYDFGVTLAVLLVLGLRSWRAGRPSGPWILAGIGTSLVGAVVQLYRIAPHPHFNHNDLFHMIQMVGLYFFYRAGLSFGLSSHREADERRV